MDRTQANAARSAGRSTFDLEIDLPASAIDDIAFVIRLLVRIEQLCAEHDLDLPARPELRSFRVELVTAIAERLQSAP